MMAMQSATENFGRSSFSSPGGDMAAAAEIPPLLNLGGKREELGLADSGIGAFTGDVIPMSLLVAGGLHAALLFRKFHGRVSGSAAEEDAGGGGGNGGPFSGGASASPSSSPSLKIAERLFIALSSKEKEEDFLAMKGCKLPQRPKKRAKLIQRTILLVSPGAWLPEMSLERYEVREKKASKKQRPRGLKAMGNLDSDSE